MSEAQALFASLGGRDYPESKQAVPTAATSSQRNIPSLDGLRAISILLVVLAHSRWDLPRAFAKNALFRFVVGNGFHGVAVFFVISGYLITTLLLREHESTGAVSLRRFYFRRTLRIFPPFYALLAVLGALWAAGIVLEEPRSFLASATYTWALYAKADGYFLTHTWSLSIEELFYLFWPLSFVWLHRRGAAALAALAMVAVMPAVRVALYFAAPSLRGHEVYMVQGWIDTMMVGCLLAVLRTRTGWQTWQRKFLRAPTAALLAIVGLVLVPWLHEVLPHRLAGFFLLAMSFSATALCIGGVLVYVVENPLTLVGRALNHRVVRHLGVISYSVYLWQQLFLSQELALLPVGFALLFAIAELSYWWIERPALALRARLEPVVLPRLRE